MLIPYLRSAVPHPTATCSNPDFSDVVTASSSGNQPYWDVEICGMVEILAEIGMAIAAVGGQKSKQSANALGIDGMKGRFAVAPGGGELRVLEEGHGRTERRWRDTQRRHHVIGRDAERTPAHQEPIALKAGRVGEIPQSFDSKICLHCLSSLLLECSCELAISRSKPLARAGAPTYAPVISSPPLADLTTPLAEYRLSVSVGP